MSQQQRTSAWVAEWVGGRLVGPGDVVVTDVGGLDDAGSGAVSFLGNPRYRDRVLPSKAAVVLVPEGFTEAPPAGRAWVVCADPSAAFTKVVTAFAPPPPTYAAGVHERAVVSPSATVAASAHVGPCAVVEAGAVIGERTVIGAGCYVGHEARVGDDCFLYPHVIGADGFGYDSGPTGHTKIPQVGIVQIDDDVEIGALAAVDRARFGRTWIQRGTKIDNLVQVAHNVVIGPHCIVVSQAGIAGSTHLGQGVILAAQAGLVGHIHIGDGAVVMAQAGVTKDVPPKGAVFGSPAVDRQDYAREQMMIKRIPRLVQSLKDLEARVRELQQRLEDEG